MAYGQHLKRNRCGTLCFRFVFPPDVRPVVGRSEVSISLGTASRRDAELARIELAALAKRVVLAARKSCAMASNDNSSSRALIDLLQRAQQNHLVRELNQAERDRDIEQHLRARALAERDTALSEKAVVQQDLEAEKALREQAHLDREAALTAKNAAEQLASRVKDKLFERVMGEPSPGTSPSLSEAIDAFCTEKQTKKAWTPKTAEMWLYRLGLLQDWFGDPRVGDITRDQFVGFVAALQRLPVNHSKIAALKGMTMAQLVESGYRPISESTVNQIMIRVSALWDWMTHNPDRWRLRGNVAKDLLLENVESEEREPYTDEDMRKMLSTIEWQERTFLYPYMYWALPLAVLTGSRINEVAQLNLDDFKVADDVPVISLCVVGKRKKNKGARRTIPVHPLLTELGLLRYVEQLRTAGELRLFPELKERRDGHGQDVSRWFARFMDRAGVTDRTKVLHSARNTLITALYRAGVDAVSVNRMTGHRGKSTSEIVYNHKHSGFDVLAGHLAKAIFSVLKEMVPPVEQVTFGTDVHKRLRKPPSQLGKRRCPRVA